MTITRRTVLAAGPVAAATMGAPAIAQTPAAPPAPTAQAPGIYRYKVGDIVVTAVHEGMGMRPLDDKFVTNAPLDQVQAALEKAFLPKDRLAISFTPLVVNNGRNLAVIDTGFADNGAPTNGNFYRNLPTAGVDPTKVDTVIISHFHGDHISGLRLKNGDAAYPNAQVMVPAAEHAFWMDDARMNQAPEAMRGAFQLARRVLEPYKDRLVRYEGDKELIPGVTAVAAPGHTPGHTAFAITSGNGRLMMVSDLTNHPALFVRNPDWSAVFDMNADQARATRRRILEMAASEKMQLAFYHAPFPATGFVAKEGNGFEYVPASWSSVL